MLSVDGTDERIPERGRDWYSHKFKKSGLRYEVAVSIKSGDICWISGPHQPGLWNDVEIFRSSLVTFLDPGERVEADDGYIGEAPLRVKCPMCVTCPQERKNMMKLVRNRQETCNKRLKQWNILVHTFRHNITDHRDVFASVCVIWQSTMANHCFLLSTILISLIISNCICSN